MRAGKSPTPVETPDGPSGAAVSSARAWNSVITGGSDPPTGMSGNLPAELMDVDAGDLFGEDEEEGGEAPEPEETERVILVDLGGEHYAMPVLEVSQVIESAPMTRVPRTSEAIDGIVDLRGSIVAVIDPWVHLDLPRGPADWADQFLAVFTEREGQQPLGIRIDGVLGVEAFPVSQVTRGIGRDDEGPNAANPLVEGVIRREEGGEVTERIGLLDTDAVIDASGRHPHETAGASAGR